MNLRFTPTSITGEKNPATNSTGFIWFNSVEIDIGVVVDVERLDIIIRECNKLKKELEK